MLPRLATTGLCLLIASLAAASDDDYLARMSREHQDDRGTPAPGAQVEPSAATSSRAVTYAHLEGTEVEGFLAVPADGSPRAGLVLVHQWWGLNDEMRALTERFAGEGYAALAVDLYGGEVAVDVESAGRLARQTSRNPDRAIDNLRQATAWLRGELGVEKVGVVGWCFGGGWSLRAGLSQGDGLDAVVMYYGRVVTDPDQLAALSAPLLGHFGNLDTGIPVESAREFAAALRRRQHDATVYIYEGAGHAFASPTSGRYNQEAAELSWQRTMEFLAKHLG